MESVANGSGVLKPISLSRAIRVLLLIGQGGQQETCRFYYLLVSSAKPESMFFFFYSFLFSLITQITCWIDRQYLLFSCCWNKPQLSRRRQRYC